MDDTTRTELEAAAFRSLVEHLREPQRRAEYRPDESRGFLPQLPVALVSGGGRGARHPLSDPEAREIVYGMPYKEWQAQHQAPATEAQKAAFTHSSKGH